MNTIWIWAALFSLLCGPAAAQSGRGAAYVFWSDTCGLIFRPDGTHKRFDADLWGNKGWYGYAVNDSNADLSFYSTVWSDCIGSCTRLYDKNKEAFYEIDVMQDGTTLLLPINEDAEFERFKVYFVNLSHCLKELTVRVRKADGVCEAFGERVVACGFWEKLGAAKHANGKDWWMAARRLETDSMTVFRVSEPGVVSSRSQKAGALLPEIDCLLLGEWVFSPSDEYFCLTVNELGLTECYDFDRCTGEVRLHYSDIVPNPDANICYWFHTECCPFTTEAYTIPRFIMRHSLPLGLAFSPDHRYVYSSDFRRLRRRPIGLLKSDELMEWPLAVSSAGTTVRLSWMGVQSDSRVYFQALSHHSQAPHPGFIPSGLSYIDNPNARLEALDFRLGEFIRADSGFSWFPFNCPHYDLGPLVSARATPSPNRAVVICDDGVHLGSYGLDPYRHLSFKWAPSAGLDGDTMAQPFARPDTTTVYTLTVRARGPVDGECYVRESHTDTVTVFVRPNPVPEFDLGPDRHLCISHKEPLWIPHDTTLRYLWSTGSRFSSTTADTSGLYWVTAIDRTTGCWRSDSVRVFYHEPEEFEPTTDKDSICLGEKATLWAPEGSDYVWTTFDRTRHTVVDKPGRYRVTMKNPGGCETTGAITIYERKGSAKIAVEGEKAEVCPGRPIRLRAAPFGTYEWTTGSTAPYIFVERPGVYGVRVVSRECESYAEVEIFAGECAAPDSVVSSVPVFPDAFTPNGDGLNDEFMPLLGQGYRKFRFEVYDRWGGLIFRSRDPGEAWDGTHKKSHCPEGVYVWKFFGELKDGNAVEKQGTVTLIR